MPDWYLQLDGEEHGPISEADFLELIRTSVVTPETKVRTSQSSPWSTASKVKGIRFASTDVKEESILEEFEPTRTWKEWFDGANEIDIFTGKQVPRPKAKPVDPMVLAQMIGVGGVIEVFEDKIAITPNGVLGFLNKGLKGTKEIPYASIIAVQFKEAGVLFSGYLQFTIPGGNESRGGLFAAAEDENTFMFAGTNNNSKAKEIKEYIDQSIRKARTRQPQPPTTNLSDELQKLAGLKDQGVLSEDEFQAAKRKLIGL
jgi:hypothetical protein